MSDIDKECDGLIRSIQAQYISSFPTFLICFLLSLLITYTYFSIDSITGLVIFLFNVKGIRDCYAYLFKRFEPYHKKEVIAYLEAAKHLNIDSLKQNLMTGYISRYKTSNDSYNGIMLSGIIMSNGSVDVLKVLLESKCVLYPYELSVQIIKSNFRELALFLFTDESTQLIDRVYTTASGKNIYDVHAHPLDWGTTLSSRFKGKNFSWMIRRSLLFQAIQTSSLDMLSALIPLDKQLAKDLAFLKFASSEGNVEAVTLLLSLDNRTALQLQKSVQESAQRGHLEVLKLLTTASTRVEAEATELLLTLGRSEKISSENKLELYELAMKHAPNSWNLTALCFKAAVEGLPDLTDFILKTHPELLDLPVNPDIFLTKEKADTNYHDDPAKLALLHLRLSQNHTLTSTHMLGKLTLLMISSIQANVEVVKLLLSRGASVNQVNEVGYSALSLLINAFQLVRWRPSSEENRMMVFQLLLNAGPSVEILNDCLKLVAFEDKSYYSMLIAAGGDVNHVGNKVCQFWSKQYRDPSGGGASVKVRLVASIENGGNVTVIEDGSQNMVLDDDSDSESDDIYFLYEYHLGVVSALESFKLRNIDFEKDVNVK